MLYHMQYNQGYWPICFDCVEVSEYIHLVSVELLGIVISSEVIQQMTVMVADGVNNSYAYTHTHLDGLVDFRSKFHFRNFWNT